MLLFNQMATLPPNDRTSESLEALLNKISIQVRLILPHIYIFNPSTCRMKTPFRCPSTLTCLNTRMLRKEHLHASSCLNPSKLTCLTIHQAPSRPKTSSSCTVHHKVCFTSDQPQDVHPPSGPVCVHFPLS